MKVEYSEDRRTAYFDSIKFRKDMKTGYYLAGKPTYNGKRERLHVYVWRYFNGPVKDGYHVHHKDENKDNNDIKNLTCIRGKTHMKYHLLEYAANHREEMYLGNRLDRLCSLKVCLSRSNIGYTRPSAATQRPRMYLS